MGKSSRHQEKRSSDRTSISLPVDFQIIDEPNTGTGFVINASEAGLLVQSFKDMAIGTTLSIKVLLSQSRGAESFRAAGKIIWKDVHLWEDWEGYQYGLEFIEISKEDCLKLRLILKDRLQLKEGQSDTKAAKQRETQKD